jgi:hypothetical protein
VTVLSLIFAIAVTFVGLSISVSATRAIPVAPSSVAALPQCITPA